MPRANRNGVEKWRPKKRAKGTRFDEGYAVRVGNRVHLRHGDRSVSTRLVWSEHNKDAALTMLDAWLGKILLGEKDDEEKAAATAPAPSLFKRHDEWIVVLKKRRASKHVLNHHTLALDLYFPHDMPINAERLYEQIERTPVDHLEVSTVRKRLTYIRMFFDWLIESNHLERNPVRRLGIPKDDRQLDNVVMTPEEVERIVGYCRDRGRTAGARYGPPNIDYAIAFELLSLVGMRTGELIQMREEHVRADGFTIKGEKGGGDREFPLWPVKPSDRSPKGRWMRRIQELLAEAVERSKARTGARRGMLFPWSDTETIWGKFQKVARALEIDLSLPDRQGRSPKTLRATAINMWADALGIPKEVRTLLSGHTESVETSNYRRRRFTAEELREKLR